MTRSRRLRQHNGELTQGAKRTKTQSRRPWRMICMVSGFQSRISALQFEHAWQHAYQTRHIKKEDRISTTRPSSRGLGKIIGNLRLLTASPSFATTPLVVHIFEESADKEWSANKFKINTEVVVEMDLRNNEEEPIGGGRTLAHIKTKKKDTYLEKSIQVVETNESSQLTAVCPHCFHTAPLASLALHFLRGTSDLIPRTGNCPQCKAPLDWHQVGSNARRIKHHHEDSTQSGSETEP